MSAISGLPDLMQSFRFTAEGLDDNRRGLISAGQRAQFSDSVGKRAAFLLPLLNLGLFCGCPAVFAWVALDRLGGSPIVALVLMIGIVGLAGFAARRMLHSARTMRRAIAQDMAAGRVDAAEMRITEDEAGEHVIAIDEVRGIELYHEAFRRLDQAPRYRVYYLPESRLVVSLEPSQSI